MSGFSHAPVMLKEVVEAMAPADGETHVDGTFGGGGYSRALLDAADIRLIAIDRDPDAATRAADLVNNIRFSFLAGRFGAMAALLGAAGIDAVDGIVLDIGVSSYQLDEARRGFSFQADGPLDMRMGDDGPTAADLVNELDAKALADLIYRYGEERQSRRIAAAIVAARADTPIERTTQLADIVARASAGPPAKIHPATRTFQALRIAVNDELGELERALIAAEHLLRPAGRLVVVAFHSLEDRIVKRFLDDRAGHGKTASRHRPQMQTGPASFRLPRRKAIKPQPSETAANPRARSARLRLAVRTEAPAREAAHV